MATVHITCPDCGDKEIDINRFVVRICLDDGRGEYRFTCPECSHIIVEMAEQAVVNELVALGARTEQWTLPAEVFEPKKGNQISDDDVIDFYRALSSEKLAAEAMQALAGEINKP